MADRAYKEMMEGKERWAENRCLADKKNCQTLTEEQHDALAWLANTRHKAKKVGMACGRDTWFADENPECQWLWNLVDGEHNEDECINTVLERAGLPKIVWGFDSFDYNTESICYELGYTEEQIEEEREKTMEMAQMFNDDIEDYLADIDKEHGTHYCPTKIAREGREERLETMREMGVIR